MSELLEARSVPRQVEVERRPNSRRLAGEMSASVMAWKWAPSSLAPGARRPRGWLKWTPRWKATIGEEADSWPKCGVLVVVVVVVREPSVVVLLLLLERGICAVARPRIMSASRGLEVGERV